jgi:hypothetical protein
VKSCIGTETYQRLKGFGKFGESFDDLFNRIMDEIEECRKVRSKNDACWRDRCVRYNRNRSGPLKHVYPFMSTGSFYDVIE